MDGISIHGWLLFLALVSPDVPTRRINEPLPAVPGTDVVDIALSADGERLAYLVLEPGTTYGVYVARTDGSVSPLRLASVAGGIQPEPEFTPDGSQVLYQRRPTGSDMQLFSVPVDGSAAPFDWGFVESYAVTADSSRLVYVQDAFTPGRFVLLSAPLDHSAGAVVLNGGLVANGDVHDFVLSPDGTRVAYRADQTTGPGLYCAPSDAFGGDELLAIGSNILPGFVIDPTGSRVVYRHDSAGNGRIGLFSVPLDASSAPVALAAPLGSNDDVGIGFALSDDGTRVAFRMTGTVNAGVYSNLLTGGTRTLLGAGAVAELALASGGADVVYRADQDGLGAVELFTVPLAGGVPPVRLNGALATGEDVLAFHVDPSGARVGFVAGAVSAARLYSVPAGGGPAVELDAHVAGVATSFAVLEQRILYLRGTVNGGELCSVPVQGGIGVILQRGEQFGPFAASPDELTVVYVVDADVAGVRELFRRATNGDTPAVQLSHEFPVDSLGSSVSSFRGGEGRVVYVSDPDASGVSGLFAAPLRYAGAPLLISDAGGPPVDVLGDVQVAERVDRALFRGAFANREYLFSAELDGGGLVVVNSIPALDGGITSYLLGPDQTLAVFRGDQDADEVFELYAGTTTVQGVPVKLSGPLVSGGDVLEGYRIAPDGAHVLYVADQDEDEVFELFLADGVATTVLSGAMVSGGDVLPDPVFSPDGSRVFFRADREVDERIELYMVPADGSAAPVALSGPIVAGGGVEDEFLLSPGGSVVVFRADALVVGRFDLFATPADGSGDFFVQLNVAPSTGSADDGFLIDPLGSRVVFHAELQLYSVPLTGLGPPVRLNDPLPGGGAVTALHYYVADVPGFRVTPDGSTVLYIADQRADNRFELFAVPIDRSSGPVVMNAALGTADVRAFVLDPSGELVAYSHWLDTVPYARQLFVVPLDRSRPPRFVDTTSVTLGGAQDDLAFSLNGRSLLYRIDHEQYGAHDLFAAPVGGPLLGRAPTADPVHR